VNTLPAQRSTDADRTHDMQLVTFTLENEEYGVDVLAVREIIRMPPVTAMPNTPHYVAGIINLRGTVVPIISLRERFGLVQSDNDRNTRILVMELDSGLTGFIVDAVAEVIRVSPTDVQGAPEAVHGGGSPDFITGVINNREKLLIALDLNGSVTDQEQADLNRVTAERH
jgi:purine-binding chemotaxis protein CheW